MECGISNARRLVGERAGFAYNGLPHPTTAFSAPPTVDRGAPRSGTPLCDEATPHERPRLARR
jgi:hypothetical protein